MNGPTIGMLGSWNPLLLLSLLQILSCPLALKARKGSIFPFFSLFFFPFFGLNTVMLLWLDIILVFNLSPSLNSEYYFF